MSLHTQPSIAQQQHCTNNSVVTNNNNSKHNEMVDFFFVFLHILERYTKVTNLDKKKIWCYRDLSSLDNKAIRFI